VLHAASPEQQEGKGATPLIWKDSASGGGHNEAMQQKTRRRDATPDLLLKHLNTTVTTYV
jgi:hypothetical protein